MTKPDVTADDVRAAIQEFDELGRRAFLAKYGFGEARRYFLRDDGADYDSKAIVGAAHTRRHNAPLTAGDFSGGEATVKKLLEDLGFEVRVKAVPSSGAVSEDALGAWVLKCNPEVWDVGSYIADGKPGISSWTVVPNYRAEMMSYGQRVLFWVTGAQDGPMPRGFWGAGWVTGEVRTTVNADDVLDDETIDVDYWIDHDARERMTHAVPVDLDIWDEPVRESDVIAVEGLDQLEIIRMRQASNPSWISSEQLALLDPLLPKWPEIGEPAAESIDLGVHGAGFGDELTRAVVERAAVEAVERYYRGRSHEVVSVERERCGWDLTCTAPDGSITRVEVKGVSGSKRNVLLTRNEHRSAAVDDGWVLAVVTNAVQKPQVTIFEASEVEAAAEPFVYSVEFD